MANTYNTKDYKESIYNDTDANNICDADEEDCFTISADEYILQSIILIIAVLQMIKVVSA